MEIASESGQATVKAPSYYIAVADRPLMSGTRGRSRAASRLMSPGPLARATETLFPLQTQAKLGDYSIEFQPTLRLGRSETYIQRRTAVS